MLTSTLTDEGQVTLPEEIRQRLGLKAGAELGVEIDTQGAIRLLPQRSQPRAPRSRLPGLLRHLAKKRSVSVEEMNEAIAEAAVERFRRSTGR